MIERTHPKLSVGAQCRLLSVSRSSFYYAPQGETAMNLDLMLLIDKQFLDTPFHGVRQMTWHLQNEGHAVNEKRIRRLMRLMRPMPICQKPDTSRPAKGHKTYPYLLGGLRVERPNQVWCADITYIPMRRGFLYLVAVIDWFTRKVPAWRISNTLEADFCVEALNEAIHRFGPPEIMNTDQGSQLTSFAWTDRLKRVRTRISMDGKGRCLDSATRSDPLVMTMNWTMVMIRNPAQSERLTTALFMFEDGSGARTAEGRTRIAQALANAAAPGDGDADRIVREQTARNISGALDHDAARGMLFDQKTAPELRLWALGQVSGARGTCTNASSFRDGWESEAISRAYAAEVTDTYRTRGTAPQTMGGEALRNTVGQAMGIAPDQLPQGELTEDFLQRGLGNRFYSAGGRNEAIDRVAGQIASLGGPEARVTVVPVTVTSRDEGAATVPVFRVEDKATGEARFVDHGGRTYRDLADWEENNTLPEGRMTYAAGLDLKAGELKGSLCLRARKYRAAKSSTVAFPRSSAAA